MSLLNRKRDPGPIQKGKPGIYWDSRSGPYYSYNGRSDYVVRIGDSEELPISACKRVYRLTAKEVEMHIASCKRGISSIRYQMKWLEKNLVLYNQ